ncbi:hypothetical protein AB0M28_23415 [Streptomyces sp. NPDC051940]|uniref:hypothetical protein n=1 Tax=Streptomyces sp. NPDC051940 TaxID=3155675 RepID=UPI003412E9D8
MHHLSRSLTAALALLVVCLTTAALAGCGGPAGSGRQPQEAVQALLDRQAKALLDRDEPSFLAAVDPRAGDYRTRQAALFRNLTDVPLAGWEYRLTSPPRREPSGRIRAGAELRYRLRGYDEAPVTVEQPLYLSERGGRWYVTGTAAGPPQLWDAGRVLVERGAHSLVLGTGTGTAARERLREIRDIAERSVPAVDDAWDGPWAGRVVVLAPATLDGMASLLDAPASGYQGIAAVTTGETGGSAAPADRVVINPEAYDSLGGVGRRIVLTHETAHVATRSATTAGTPLWLSEGFADWAGYLGSHTTARQAAPELARALGRGELPKTLPADDDFRFGGDADHLARAYEESWLACALIAERWGPDRLRALYRAVGADKRPGDAVERALRAELGVGRAEFVRLWRAYLRDRLG